MRAGGLETDEADARADDAAGRRKVPVQARSRQRVERVLDTAARLVDDIGPEAVTTASIAAAAGVSIGWLYDFFPNRESVFDAVVERSFEKVTPLAESVHASMPAADWRETLEAVVWTLFDFYRDEPGFRVLWFSRFQSAAMVAVPLVLCSRSSGAGAPASATSCFGPASACSPAATATDQSSRGRNRNRTSRTRFIRHLPETAKLHPSASSFTGRRPMSHCLETSRKGGKCKSR